MKKLLKIVGIVAVVLVVALVLFILYENGTFDTRFWSNDESVYKPFYSGKYVCGVDLVPGSYEVEIKGGSSGYGFLLTYDSVEELDKNNFLSSIPLYEGEKGFRFSLEEGQVLELNLDNTHEMRYKKIN